MLDRSLSLNAEISFARQKDRSTLRILLVLLAAALILILIYMVWGLNARNLDYNLKRRSGKILAVLLVSAATGFSSVTFQTITGNKILTPSVMGLDSLYLLIQTVVVFFFGAQQLSLMSGYSEFFISAGIMVLASWGVFNLMFHGENQNIYFIVLAGIILGSLFEGLSTFMAILLDPNEYEVLQTRMYASFNNVNTELLGLSAVLILILLIAALPDLKRLDVLHLGMIPSVNLGINYKALVLRTLMYTAVLVAISTVLTGPMAFLSILVVSLSRSLVPTYRHREQIMGASLLGCIALLLGLIVTERLFQFETQVSTIINFIGGIYFIYLVVKEAGNDFGKKRRQKISG